MAALRLWEGLYKTSRPWDSLRRDDDLWDPDADCFIHLYSPGQSKRGPSFFVPLKKLVAYNLEEFIKLSREGVAYEPTPKPKRVRFSTQDVASEPYLDLFVPSPPGLAKEEAHEFHITTRNLIAWVVGRPIVGVCLGKALIDLVERLKLYRPDHRRNKIQVTKYAISQGYTNYKDDAEHSLGILNFAEHIEDEKLWREAFVHCVGMRDRLNDSLQYKSASYKTTSWINQHRRRLDLQIRNANRALSNFFHAELAGVHFGLAGSHRAHYDAFRSYLHIFYKERFGGRWPPTNLETDFTMARPIVLSMYAEFRNLYNYLVDSTSSYIGSHHGDQVDDLDITQRVVSFDQKHRFETLKNPLPLLPKFENPSFSTPIRQLQKRQRRESLSDRKMQLVSLLRATNREDLKARACPLTFHYASFEKAQCLETSDKASLSLTEGRQIRWLLIYAIVQTLVSVLRAPPEVKDSITGSYPLCCKIPRRPPWYRSRSRPVQRPGSAASHLSSTSLLYQRHGRNVSTATAPATTSAPIPGALETDLSYAIRKLAFQPRHSVHTSISSTSSKAILNLDTPLPMPSTFTQMAMPFPAFSNTPFVNKNTALHSHTPSAAFAVASSSGPSADATKPEQLPDRTVQSATKASNVLSDASASKTSVSISSISNSNSGTIEHGSNRPSSDSPTSISTARTASSASASLPASARSSTISFSISESGAASIRESGSGGRKRLDLDLTDMDHLSVMGHDDDSGMDNNNNNENEEEKGKEKEEEDEQGEVVPNKSLGWDDGAEEENDEMQEEEEGEDEFDLPPEEKAQIVRFLRAQRSVQSIGPRGAFGDENRDGNGNGNGTGNGTGNGKAEAEAEMEQA